MSPIAAIYPWLAFYMHLQSARATLLLLDSGVNDFGQHDWPAFGEAPVLARFAKDVIVPSMSMLSSLTTEAEE